MKKRPGRKRIHWTGVPLRVKEAKDVPEPEVTPMTVGAGGCSRCRGFVIRTAETILEANEILPVMKCLLCGARKYEDEGECHAAAH